MFLTNCKPIKFSISKTFKSPPDRIIIIIEQNASLFFREILNCEKSGKQKENYTFVTNLENISFTLDITAFRNL